MDTGSSRTIRLLVIPFVMIALLGWKFYLQPRRAMNASWRGEIVQRDMELRSGRYKFYYWTVECEDGKQRRVKVPEDLWEESEEGDPVRKAEGRLHPTLVQTGGGKNKEKITEP
jgi:hypothetical protein